MKTSSIRIGTRVRIVSSHPVVGQCDVESLIGKTFKVIDIGRDWQNNKTDEVTVNCQEFGGMIVLNASEYEAVP